MDDSREEDQVLTTVAPLLGGKRVTLGLADTIGSGETVDLRRSLPESLDAPPKECGLRYRELGLLGQGGLGLVVEAYDEDLRRTVAVKRPRDDQL